MANILHHSAEDFSRRGGELFDREIRPTLRAEDHDNFVAIDIETGAYELDGDDFAATERLLARQPGALIWVARVGQPAAYRIGGRLSSADTE